MIYNAENGILYGATANCFTTFGISTKLIYGNGKN